MKNKLINLFIFLFGLSFASLLGEFIIRKITPQKLLRPCIIPDADLAFRGVKNCSYLDNWTPEFYEYYVQLNNLGLRMERDISPNDSNQILCLGDSFTYGMGVNYDDSFYAHLEDCPDRFGINKQLINGAFQAYSTGHSTKTLNRLADKLSIEKVIYFMYFNDLFDNVNMDKNYRPYTFEETQQGEINLESVKVYAPFKRFWHRLGVADWLYKNSHLIILLKNNLTRSRTSFVNNDPRKSKILTAAEIEEMQKVSLAHIENLSNECNKRNLDLMVVWIPCWLELSAENNFGWHNNFPFEDFKPKLAETTHHQKNVDFFDATNNMNQLLAVKKQSISTYYFKEGHYTEKGNLLFFNSVKDAVLTYISKK